ncbi:MAG: HEPN domain-containing protein [Bacteroidales bacterium]|nr:HEPN domain-containing protein [Bacteroidales bacterium]
MIIAKSESWKEFHKEAEDYSKAAFSAFEKGKFTHDTLYNIICMSIEKYLVAFSIFHGQMPMNHTLSGLIEEIKVKFPVTDELKKGIFFIDTFQDICIITSAQRKEPNNLEMKRMIDIMVDVKAWVNAKIVTE